MLPLVLTAVGLSVVYFWLNIKRSYFIRDFTKSRPAGDTPLHLRVRQSSEEVSSRDPTWHLKQTQPQEAEFLEPVECLDEDEEELMDWAVAQGMRKSKKLKPDAGWDPKYHEPMWGHTTCLMAGELVLDNIETLPERMRAGLFEKNRTLKAVVRPNVHLDPDLPLLSARISIKLQFPTSVVNEYTGQDADEVDIMLAEMPVDENDTKFFARDARELAILGILDPPVFSSLMMARNWSLMAKLISKVLKFKADSDKGVDTGVMGKVAC
mmetsp:Transcript_22532/g.35240  ORF Transcript_22532/g.35240 Transcript_22532/m.35240 type:complete len:267 (-) Transcript_22532:841-1641(-)